jgi:hypothetical protein
MVFSYFRQKSLSFCLLLGVTCLFGAGNASAQQVGPGCDPVFMKAMQDKAWMEAQREIMIAQTTIAKPDSVFSLGCFSTWAGALSASFTNGSNYNYSSQLTSYLNAAFNHTLGGGHYSGSNTTSSCSSMANLWNNVRGANLDSPSRLLDTLKDISTYNRGAFPTSFSAPSGFTAPLSKFYDPRDPTNPAHKNKSVGAAFDDMDLFAGLTAPASQLTTSPNNRCAAGIPTGVDISTTEKEIVCPNPGCIPNTASPPKCCDYTGAKCSP